MQSCASRSHGLLLWLRLWLLLLLHLALGLLHFLCTAQC
jgi:hypothetical protein